MEEVGVAAVEIDLVERRGVPAGDEQVAVETDNDAEWIAHGGRGHPDKGAGCPIVLPNSMVKLAGDKQVLGDHFSFLLVPARGRISRLRLRRRSAATELLTSQRHFLTQIVEGPKQLCN